MKRTIIILREVVLSVFSKDLLKNGTSPKFNVFLINKLNLVLVDYLYILLTVILFMFSFLLK